MAIPECNVDKSGSSSGNLLRLCGLWAAIQCCLVSSRIILFERVDSVCILVIRRAVT